MTYTLSTVDDEGQLLIDPSGAYTITVRAADRAGNSTDAWKNSVTHVFVDNQSPKSTLSFPSLGTTAEDGTQILGDTAITVTTPFSGAVNETGAYASGVASQEVRLTPADNGVAPGLWEGRYYANSDVSGMPC